MAEGLVHERRRITGNVLAAVGGTVRTQVHDLLDVRVVEDAEPILGNQLLEHSLHPVALY